MTPLAAYVAKYLGPGITMSPTGNMSTTHKLCMHLKHVGVIWYFFFIQAYI
jgi:hypothetical protein